MYALLDSAQVQMAVVRTYCGVYSCLTLFSGLHLGQLKSQILQTGWVSRSEALALPWCTRWEEVRHPPCPHPLMWETVLSSALAVPCPTEVCLECASPWCQELSPLSPATQ